MGFLPGTEPINQTAELVTANGATATAGDTNTTWAWATVHDLEAGLYAWLRQYDKGGWLLILEKMHELRQRSANWPRLTAALPQPHRPRDVYQAIANVLDQQRQKNTRERPDPAAEYRLENYAISMQTAEWLATITETLARLSAAVQQTTRAEANARFRPRCNGRQHWRSDRYLYAIHTAGQECPLHGRHAEPLQRLRTYVGGNQADQEAVLTAMKNWQAWQESVRILDAARDRLAALERDISDLHRRWCGSASPSPTKELSMD